MAKTFIELDSNDIEEGNRIVVKRWVANEQDFNRFASELEAISGPEDTIIPLGSSEGQSIEDFLNFQSQMCGKIVWDRITDR